MLQSATPQVILDKLEDTLTLKGESRGLSTHLGDSDTGKGAILVVLVPLRGVAVGVVALEG